MFLRLFLVRDKSQLSWLSWHDACSTPSDQQHFFVEIDNEVFSTFILSLPLIQEGHLSVSGKRLCTILINHFED